MDKSKIKAILLVAGEGKRLRPYTLNRPKCMVEIDGVSLLDRQLEILKSQGVSNLVMVGGYKSEMLKREGIKLRVNTRYAETNMVWTLFCVENELEGEVIVSYGDIVYSKEILQALLESTADIAITIDKDWENYWRTRNENPLDDAETLKLREDGTISEIGQKPKSLNEIEGQYMGLIKLTAKGISQVKDVFHAAAQNLDLLGRSVEQAYMTDLLQAVINANIPITAVPVYGGWVEIDTVDDKQSINTRNRLIDIMNSV